MKYRYWEAWDLCTRYPSIKNDGTYEVWSHNIKLNTKEVFLKQCCGVAPAVWKSTRRPQGMSTGWICSVCDGPVEYEQQELSYGSIVNSSPRISVCECGAEKANTTHAFYCPKYNP